MVVSPEERCPRGYVTIIQDMYNDCETLVSTRTGDTEYFRVGVGLHQGSALSPLLFILIMDVLQAEIGKEPPWVMLFADDLVICEHSRAEVEIQLERWRETFESHGLRVSRGKTEYMPCPERDQTIYIQEKEVKTVKMFKYLGSMFDANGGAEKDVNNRVKIAGSKWRETTGVMCDRNIPTKLKDKVYKTAIKPAMVASVQCQNKTEPCTGFLTDEENLLWPVNSYIFIYSQHFVPSDFMNNVKNEMEFLIGQVPSKTAMSTH